MQNAGSPYLLFDCCYINFLNSTDSKIARITNNTDSNSKEHRFTKLLSDCSGSKVQNA